MVTKSRTTEKKGTTKSKTRKKKSQAVRTPKISWVVKPDKMTLEEWQRALRKQIAGEEASNEWLEAVSEEDYNKLK